MSNRVERLKICPACDRELPVDKFWKHRGTADGLQAWCKDCKSLYKVVNIDNLTEAQRAHKIRMQKKSGGPRTREELIDYMRANSAIPLKILEKAQVEGNKIPIAAVRAAQYWLDTAFKEDVTKIEIDGRVSLTEAIKSAMLDWRAEEEVNAKISPRNNNDISH